jgi:hypothetical protein
MLILTLLVLVDLVRDISGVLRDIVPMLRLARSVVYTFASVTATVFFFVSMSGKLSGHRLNSDLPQRLPRLNQFLKSLVH